MFPGSQTAAAWEDIRHAWDLVSGEFLVVLLCHNEPNGIEAQWDLASWGRGEGCERTSHPDDIDCSWLFGLYSFDPPKCVRGVVRVKAAREGQHYDDRYARGP